MSTPTPLPTTELVNPNTDNLDRLPTVEMLERINDEDAKVAAAVRVALPQIARAVDVIADALRAGGRLVYVGAGTSGRLGCLDAAECLPTFGVPPEMVFGIIAGGERALLRAVEGAEDDREAGEAAMDAADVGPNDVVVGISASGGAPYVRGAVTRAKARGARATVSVVNSPNAPLSGDVDIAIEVVTGPEVIQGSTRLKAGTGQKLVLNMLTTGAMVRIGKTYGNRMVDVQTTNKKLVSRARRLVRELGRVDSDEAADALLSQAGGSVKRAIVLARRGVDPDEAERLLAEANGFLSVVLGE
ncbi:MAG TPA: N-acetylmuramic acid 6-phosphate etherase [Armatimonadaceae bacterium]|nr:N-acetylmuramic acid 6-phosphate etherase [Armatimonadaceae bacterium]